MKPKQLHSMILNIKPVKILFLLTIILSSCSESLPSEQFAKEQLNSNTKYPYELTDFKKTNGIKGNNKGQETYQMNFHSKLVARDSIYTFVKMGRDTINVLKTDTSRVKSLLARNPFQRIYWEKVSGFRKGEVVKEIDGVARFVKTENGWEIISRAK